MWPFPRASLIAQLVKNLPARQFNSWVRKIRWRMIGYTLQYSWASLVAQLVKTPPVMRETWVRSLVWEDPLEKGKAAHSSILTWRILWIVHGVAKSQTRLNDFHFHIHLAFL